MYPAMKPITSTSPGVGYLLATSAVLVFFLLRTEVMIPDAGGWVLFGVLVALVLLYGVRFRLVFDEGATIVVRSLWMGKVACYNNGMFQLVALASFGSSGEKSQMREEAGKQAALYSLILSDLDGNNESAVPLVPKSMVIALAMRSAKRNVNIQGVPTPPMP
jgi:hypothetical protein